jgi:putative tryptophan/tyrosine transport system substrate-binding protein
VITRRQSLVLLAAAASLAPLASSAQSPPKIRRIGFLTPRSLPDPFFEAFRQGMRELGYVDGTNVTIEPRFADGTYDRLPALAAERVGDGPRDHRHLRHRRREGEITSSPGA